MATAYVEIPLGGEKAAGRVALIDVEDYELVSPYHWCVLEQERKGRTHGPYAIRRSGLPGGTLMHKLITGFSSTDHQDHDGLNNRRKNLRDGQRNQQNVRGHLNGSSRYKGVTRRRTRYQTRWIAQVGSCYLGSFPSEELAALAYDTAAREMYGEYAYVNFLEGATDDNQPPRHP